MLVARHQPSVQSSGRPQRFSSERAVAQHSIYSQLARLAVQNNTLGVTMTRLACNKAQPTTVSSVALTAMMHAQVHDRQLHAWMARASQAAACVENFHKRKVDASEK